jgi:dGTPase
MQSREELEGIGFGYRPRAPYACDPEQSRGRLVDEAESPTRTPFQRDRDRIIHSTAFRRLKHKTQVFIAHEGDHYRTRLTHTIEVAQIARALARALRGDEDLAEAIALVHDFGHTPFGHTGEDALNEKLARMGRLRPQRAVAAGRDAAGAALCRVRRAEPHLGDAGGAGQAQWPADRCERDKGSTVRCRRRSATIRNCTICDLAECASLEAQCAAIADDIAYNTHDIDDGLRAGLADAGHAEGMPLAGRSCRKSTSAIRPSIRSGRDTNSCAGRSRAMVEDVIVTSKANLDRLAPQSADDVRKAAG